MKQLQNDMVLICRQFSESERMTALVLFEEIAANVLDHCRQLLLRSPDDGLIFVLATSANPMI